MNSGKVVLARTLWFTAKYNIHDAYLKDLIQETADVYRDSTDPREAVAFFFGALKLSYNKQTVHFAKREFERHLRTDRRLIRELTRVRSLHVPGGGAGVQRVPQ